MILGYGIVQEQVADMYCIIFAKVADFSQVMAHICQTATSMARKKAK